MAAGLLSHPWAYPALEVVHLLGISLLLGNLLLLDLRLLAGPRELPLPPLVRLCLPLALAGFALAGASGLTMFAAQPAELLANRAFTLKMGLLLLAGINAGLFHGRGGFARVDGWSRLQLALSALLWVAVLACGRWIAYR